MEQSNPWFRRRRRRRRPHLPLPFVPLFDDPNMTSEFHHLLYTMFQDLLPTPWKFVPEQKLVYELGKRDRYRFRT